MNRRPDSHPYAAKMSVCWPGATCLSHFKKSWTSGMMSSPAYMASCWSRMAPLVAGAASDVTKAGSYALAPQLAKGTEKFCCFMALAMRTKTPVSPAMKIPFTPFCCMLTTSELKLASVGSMTARRRTCSPPTRPPSPPLDRRPLADWAFSTKQAMCSITDGPNLALK